MSEVPLANVTGYVLAGGRSSRMGRDKATLPWKGSTLLEHALRLLEKVCLRHAVLCGNAERAALLQPYAPDAAMVCEDLPGEGPLAGVAAAAADAQTPWLLVMPIDLPLLPAEAIATWVRAHANDGEQPPSVHCLGAHQVVQPLPVLLQRRLAPRFAELLARGERRLRPALAEAADASGSTLRVTVVTELPGGSDEWFRNLNRPEDLLDLPA